MRISSAMAFFPSLLVLAGCLAVPVTTKTSTQTNPTQGAAIRGIVHGGEQVVSDADVYLFAVNITGNAGPGIAASSSNASVSLLNSSTGNPPDSNGNYYVTTSSNGAWSISGNYNCPSSATDVYLLAVGGNPGLTPGTNNTSMELLAALGACGNLTSSTYVIINEVSTIAMAYALAGYATDPTHISSSGSTLALEGVSNAFTTVTNLETLNTGVAVATNANGTAPQATLNTLANILAACSNSSGTVTGPANPTPCYTLFTNALSGGTSGTQPADTATAAINIAHNPWANEANLYALQTPSSPFQPMDVGPTGGWIIAFLVNIGGPFTIPNPSSIPAGNCVDPAGNIYLAYPQDGSVIVYSPIGQYLGQYSVSTSPTNTLGPITILVTAGTISGYIWTGNDDASSLSELNSSGTVLSGTSGYAGGGLDDPDWMAADSNNNIWLTNDGNNSLTEYNPTTGFVSPSTGYTGGGLDVPLGIAIDPSNRVWVANSNNSLSEFNSSGTAVSPSTGYTGGGLSAPAGVALDPANNVWVANPGNSSLTEYNPTTGFVSPSTGYTGGGLSFPGSLAVDSNGIVYAINNNDSISVFNNNGTPITGSSGYVNSALTFPYGIAIDSSGNVFVAVGFGDYSLVEFVGLASPVVTPMAANLQSPYGSSPVNRP